MPNRREHLKLSRKFLGDSSLGDSFQKLLDLHAQESGAFKHRRLDHSYKRLCRISNFYTGELKVLKGAVEMEIIVHIAADYDLL